MRLPALFFCAMLLLTGCSSGAKELARERAQTIDSLRAENDMLRARLHLYEDSLQFYDDIQSGQYHRERRTLEARLDQMQYDITVLREGGRTLTAISADDLFEPASATLTSTGEELLATVADDLKEVYPNRLVRVEGHSDNAPLSPTLQEKYTSNWELSAARAAAVVRHLTEAHELESKRFVIAAFADTHPVASNESAAGRRQNRRVRIAVLPKPNDYARPFSEAW